jgi:hypothetical protein
MPLVPDEVYLKRYSTASGRMSVLRILGAVIVADCAFGAWIVFTLRTTLPVRGYLLAGIAWVTLFGLWMGTKLRYQRIQELQELHYDSPEWSRTLAVMAGWIFELCMLVVLTVGTMFFAMWVVGRQLI